MLVEWALHAKTDYSQFKRVAWSHAQSVLVYVIMTANNKKPLVCRLSGSGSSKDEE